jgi:formylglycine-generating enzyme required for sulfatase activity
MSWHNKHRHGQAHRASAPALETGRPTAIARRGFLQTALAGAAGSVLASVPGLTAGDAAPNDGQPQTIAGQTAGDRPPFKFEPDQPLIHAPESSGDWPEFRRRLADWRRETRQRLNYTGALYERAEFRWARQCFSCCFVMLCDETFYDPKRGCYTLESFLAEGRREFGGYDAVVLWHAYPRIGIDYRNQFDFYRDMPGGLAGLKEVSRVLHAHQVRVFIDYNPWDTGTRREPVNDLEALAQLVSAIDADGIFLDTMDRGAADFRARLDAARPGVVLESEGALPLANVHDHHASWAQWFGDRTAPGVLRNKWFERRHIQHQIQRWNRDHTAELHSAWMNGSGMLVWENVFGTWVGWSARDRSILRAMLPIQRRFAPLFTGERWTPLVETLAPRVFASLWESDVLRLWTLTNRAEQAVTGPLLTVSAVPDAAYFDLIRGHPVEARAGGGGVTLSGTIPPRGIGAFIAAAPTALGRDFQDFLAEQRRLNERATPETTFPARKAILRPPPATRRARAPEGMVAIAGRSLELEVTLQVRECGFYGDAADAQRITSGLHQPHAEKRQVVLRDYALDLTPVTNADYSSFLRATHYQPRHPENFLRHWRQGAPPDGKEQHPVVYVDLDDARAYAAWAGKRLPTEEEWQFAAAGPERRRYPWGGQLQPDCCNDGATGDTTPVRAFPNGRSPFGCYDMCGNTWEWTESEHTDGRTRFCMVRGGSWYQAKGSGWYADGGPKPCDFAAKFLLMWPGLDRCATIGFRCAVSLAPATA